MSDETPVDIPIVVPPKKESKFALLSARMDDQDRSIGILSQAIKDLITGLQTPTSQGPPLSPREPIPVAPASSVPASAYDLISMMKGMMEIQNTMKAGMMQDLQIAQTLLLNGGADEDEGDEDDPLTNLVANYLKARQGGGAGPGPLPPLPQTPSPPSPFVKPGKPVPLDRPAEPEEDEEDE